MMDCKELYAVETEWAHDGEGDVSIALFETEAMAKKRMTDIISEEQREGLIKSWTDGSAYPVCVEESPSCYTAFVDGDYSQEHLRVCIECLPVNWEDRELNRMEVKCNE